MNEHTKKQLLTFARILKACGLKKEETGAILSMMRKEETVLEIVERIEEKYPSITPQETLKICAEAVKKNEE